MGGETDNRNGKKVEARERRPDFVYVYRELLYCYGRMIGTRGIAVWSYVKIHQYGGEVWKELVGYAWTSQSRMCADLGLKDARTIRGVIQTLEQAGLLTRVKAADLFGTDDLIRLRQQAQGGERLYLQPASILLVAHDPLPREEFVRWNAGRECATCGHARGCKAFHEYTRQETPGQKSASSESGAFFAPLASAGGPSGAFFAPPSAEATAQGGAFFAPNPWKEGKEKERKTTTGAAAVVLVDPSAEEDMGQPVAPSQEHLNNPADLLAVLDHFADRVAERWPTATDRQGQPLARVVRDRYEGPRALLTAAVSPAAVSRAPAELVEELSILACVLRFHGPTALERAVDRALAQSGKGPARRLAYIWPEVPGARQVRAALNCNLREGGRLPDGGGYRDARRLLILLNRFDVGPPLLQRFVQLCGEVGIGAVRSALGRALQDGRPFVALAYLREAVRRQREAGGTGREIAPDGPGQPAGPPAAAPAGPTPAGAGGAGVPGKTPMGGPLDGLAASGGPDREPTAPPGNGDGAGMETPAAAPSPADLIILPGVAESAGETVVPPGTPLDGEPSCRAWTGGRLPERELVRYWLREYGIVGPPLEELPGRVRLAQVRAWMLYLDHQEKLDDTKRRGILVNRLRAGDEPPRQYRWWALLLPPVDPIEEIMLEEDYEERRYGGSRWWSEDVLEVVGEERAERWLEAREKRPR